MLVALKQKQRLKKMAQKHGLKLILLFGSRISGGTHKNSDLDVAVMLGEDGKNDLSLKQYLDIISGLRKAFPGFKIDLSLINRANPLHLYSISESCQKVFGSQKDLLKFKLYAFHRYNDYRPYFDLEKQYVRNFIKDLKYAN